MLDGWLLACVVEPRVAEDDASVAHAAEDEHAPDRVQRLTNHLQATQQRQ